VGKLPLNFRAPKAALHGRWQPGRVFRRNGDAMIQRKTFLLSLLSLFAPLAAFAEEQDVPTTGKSFWGWFPANINPAYGHTVDGLYLVIMIIVLVAFFATELCLLYCCFAFSSREGRRAKYMHGSNKLEVVWTVIPAIMLFALALVQTKSWAEIKIEMPKESEAFTVQVFPEQFKWHFRYPNDEEGYFPDKDHPKAKWGNKFNILTNSWLHIPINTKVMTKMVSRDVIHSLFIPNARVKQDVLPGMLTRTWFKVDRIPCWDLKTQQLVFLTQQEFESHTVAIASDDWTFERKPKGATLDASGKWVGGKDTGEVDLTYKPYVSKKTGKQKEKFKVVKGTVITEVPLDQVEYIHHYAEIACAELCGMGHTTMRAFMKVHTPTTLKAWVDAEVADMRDQDGPSEAEANKWKIFDKFYSHFNNQ
jgi:cytochrome c oxidase subunit 2